MAAISTQSPVSLDEMYSRSVVAQNLNREKLDKLQNPGMMHAMWDTVTFQRHKKQKQIEQLRSANDLIKQIMEQLSNTLSQAYR